MQAKYLYEDRLRRRLRKRLARKQRYRVPTKSREILVRSKGNDKKMVKSIDKKYQLGIRENAVDSFNEALIKYRAGADGDTKSHKFAILHMSHFVELILKLYLVNLDEFLLFTKCFNKVRAEAKASKTDLLSAYNRLIGNGIDFEKCISGDSRPFTVNVSQALAVAKCEVCSITGNHFVDKDFSDDVSWMKDLRNDIEHYQFELDPYEVRLVLGRITRGVCEFIDCFELFDLEASVGKEAIDTFKVLSDEYEHTLEEAGIAVGQARKHTFRGVRPKHMMDVHWREYLCPECDKRLMIPDADSCTGYKCTMCGNCESHEIEVECEICGQEWPNEEMTSWIDTYDYVCPRCNNPEAW